MSSYPPSQTSQTEITNTTISTAPSITLDPLQKQQVGLVLDLFQAKGTMEKIDRWLTEDVVYEDLFATTLGREQVAGQFLGLPVVCQSSETLSHTLKTLNPSPLTPNQTHKGTHDIPYSKYPKMYQLDLEVKHKFVFKPLGNEVVMNSTIQIWANPEEEGGRIVRIQDRPVQEIPENSLITFMRKMNAVVAPKILGVHSSAA